MKIPLYNLLHRQFSQCGNQLKKFLKFRVVLSSGSHETGSRAKKVTASDSAKPGPHIDIFFLIQGLWCIDAIKFLWRSGRGLELNFLGFQIEENFWEAKF